MRILCPFGHAIPFLTRRATSTQTPLPNVVSNLEIISSGYASAFKQWTDALSSVAEMHTDDMGTTRNAASFLFFGTAGALDRFLALQRLWARPIFLHLDNFVCFGSLYIFPARILGKEFFGPESPACVG